MSEKLCLQWNDFRANVHSAFGKLRDDKEFTDVTLACEDGQKLEAHKVILAASSPFFEKILQNSKHPHPLIYLRGFQSKDLVAILDFLYFGEANVFQENLDSFLAIAEELKLKGLTDQTSSDLLNEQANPENCKPAKKSKELFTKYPTYSADLAPKLAAAEKVSRVVAIPNELTGDLQALDEKVKSMMEKGQKFVPSGKRADGTQKRELAFICKVCGKEGRGTNIRDHIEVVHLEGISIPCATCGKVFSSRNTLANHKSRHHRSQA